MHGDVYRESSALFIYTNGGDISRECFDSCKDNIRDGTFASFFVVFILVFLVAACADDCTPGLRKVFLCADYGGAHVAGDVYVGAAVEQEGDGGCLVGCEA